MRTLPLISSTILCAAALTTCDSEVTEPPFLPETSPTPTEEATAMPEPSATAIPADLEGFRQFAVHVEEAVRSRDADWFTSMATVASLVCPVSYPTQSICEGVPDGTVVRGVQIGLWRGEGQLQPADEFQASSLQYLSSLAEPVLYAIAAADRYVGGSIGGPAVFAVVASADDPSNTTRVFEFVEHGGAWSMPLVIHVTNLAEEWLSGKCSDCYDRWERWEDTP